MPLFQRRHYDQLAWWAGTNLDLQTLPSLLDLLANDNPAFQKNRFIAACKTHRALADTAGHVGYYTAPKPIEANLDAIISNSEKTP